MTNIHRQSGNIVIYIIGAIFLLGLLILLVRGSANPGGGIDRETLILKASQVRAYSAELQRGVEFILNNGHSETEIRFAHPNHASAYGTYGTTPTAEVFNPSGGGAEWRDNDADVQASASDWVFTAANELSGIGSTCAASSCADLMAVLPNVTSAFCIYINETLGITNPAGVPPQDQGTATLTTLFSGSYTYATTIVDAANNLQFKDEGCFEGGGTPAAGTWHYYKVLLSR